MVERERERAVSHHEGEGGVGSSILVPVLFSPLLHLVFCDFLTFI